MADGGTVLAKSAVVCITAGCWNLSFFKLSSSSQATRKSRFSAVTIKSLTLKIMVSSNACNASRNACSSSKSGSGTLTERTRISAFGLRVIFFIYCVPSMRIALMIDHSTPYDIQRPRFEQARLGSYACSNRSDITYFLFVLLTRFPLYQHHRPSSLTGSLVLFIDILQFTNFPHTHKHNLRSPQPSCYVQR